MPKKIKLVRLYDLKKGSEIHGLELKIEGKTYRDAVVVFDHVDGMYSYNTLKDKDGNPLKHKDGTTCVVHLANGALLKKVDDHYVMSTESEEKEFNS